MHHRFNYKTVCVLAVIAFGVVVSTHGDTVMANDNKDKAKTEKKDDRSWLEKLYYDKIRPSIKVETPDPPSVNPGAPGLRGDNEDPCKFSKHC